VSGHREIPDVPGGGGGRPDGGRFSLAAPGVLLSWLRGGYQPMLPPSRDPDPSDNIPWPSSSLSLFWYWLGFGALVLSGGIGLHQNLNQLAELAEWHAWQFGHDFVRQPLEGFERDEELELFGFELGLQEFLGPVHRACLLSQGSLIPKNPRHASEGLLVDALLATMLQDNYPRLVPV